jgi:hypothetical protein
MPKSAVSLGRALNGHLTPVMLSWGFELQSGTSRGEWREGAFFTRTRGEWAALVLVGRTKFGKRLALSVLRTRQGENPVPLALVDAGLSNPDLAYNDQPGLVAVVERVVRAFDPKILLWLEGGA